MTVMPSLSELGSVKDAPRNTVYVSDTIEIISKLYSSVRQNYEEEITLTYL